MRNLFEEKALDRIDLFFGDRDKQYREKLKGMAFSSDASSADASDFVQRITQFITFVKGLEEKQLKAEQARQSNFGSGNDEFQFLMELDSFPTETEQAPSLQFESDDESPFSIDIDEELPQTYSENDSLLSGNEHEASDEEEADSETPINLVELSLFAFSYFKKELEEKKSNPNFADCFFYLKNLFDHCEQKAKEKYGIVRGLVINESIRSIINKNKKFFQENKIYITNFNKKVEGYLAKLIVNRVDEAEQNISLLVKKEAERLFQEKKAPLSSVGNSSDNQGKKELYQTGSSDNLNLSQQGEISSTKLSQPHKILQWAQLVMIFSYIVMITVQNLLSNPPAGLESVTTAGSVVMPFIMLLLAWGDYRCWSEVTGNNNPDVAEKKKAAKFTPLIPCLFLVANALKFAVDEHAVDAVLYSVLILIGVFKWLTSKDTQDTQDSEQSNNLKKIGKKIGTGLLGLAFAGGILNSAVTAWSQQTAISALQIPGGGFMDAMSQAGPIISGAFLVAVGVSIALKAYDTYQLHDKGIEQEVGFS